MYTEYGEIFQLFHLTFKSDLISSFKGGRFQTIIKISCAMLQAKKEEIYEVLEKYNVGENAYQFLAGV